MQLPIKGSLRTLLFCTEIVTVNTADNANHEAIVAYLFSTLIGHAQGQLKTVMKKRRLYEECQLCLQAA
jgi:hypothetical protein